MTTCMPENKGQLSIFLLLGKLIAVWFSHIYISLYCCLFFFLLVVDAVTINTCHPPPPSESGSIRPSIHLLLHMMDDE